MKGKGKLKYLKENVKEEKNKMKRKQISHKSKRK